jgi:hypothetical protein
MATRYSIAEQVLLKIYGRSPKPSDPIQWQPPDVILAVGQAANGMLRMQHFEALKMGDYQPSNLVIATYPKQPLATFGGRKSKCTLPAMPANLIRNMGIYEVSTKEDFSCLLIPLGAGQADLLRSADVISDIMGQAGYENYGRDIITTRDLTIDNIDGLYFRLVVTDVTALGDYDPLPIPSSMEFDLIQQVYQSFVPAPPADRKVDAYAANPQPAQS